MVPPPSNDPALRWTWNNDPRVWASTHFDCDGNPHLIEVPDVGVGPRIITLMLLHELSHMRNPDIECGRRRRWWREECRRLEALGAFGREGIF